MTAGERTKNDSPAGMDKELIDILVCPACGGDLKVLQESISCLSCGRRYPVRNGIPVLIIEKAALPDGKR